MPVQGNSFYLGPRAGAERLVEGRSFPGFVDTADAVGKAEGKEGYGEAVVQRQEPQALPSLLPNLLQEALSSWGSSPL